MDFSITNMTVEYRTPPVFLDTPRPRFGWNLESDRNGLLQDSYRILIRSTECEVPLWDSGRIHSDEMAAIEYGGEPLSSQTIYDWTLQVWDTDGGFFQQHTRFETAFVKADIPGPLRGLLTTGQDDGLPQEAVFGDAKWIGCDQLSLYADYLSVFRMDASFSIQPGSVRAGFCLSGDDPRLMDRNKNLFDLEHAQGESYIACVLDVSNLICSASDLNSNTQTDSVPKSSDNTFSKSASDTSTLSFSYSDTFSLPNPDAAPDSSSRHAVLYLYRCGYAPDDSADVPFACIPISRSLLDSSNCFDTHTIILEYVYGECDFYLDQKDNAHRLTNERLNLNPIGRGGDYICFPVLGKIGTFLEEGQEADFSFLEVRNFRPPCNVLYHGIPGRSECCEPSHSRMSDSPYCAMQKHSSGFTGNTSSDRSGHTVSALHADPACSPSPIHLFDVSHGGLPMLRTDFVLKKPLRKARLFATSRGIYELYLNGRRVGEDYFAPGLSQYDKRFYYQEYTVTDFLKDGGNGLGAILAEGWWSGAISYVGSNWNYFGDRSSLILRLEITYTDDSTEHIVTTPDTWQASMDGPIRFAGFFQGEVRDTGKEDLLESFSCYQGAAWPKADEIPYAKENSYCDEVPPTACPPFSAPAPVTCGKPVFALQPDEGVRVRQTLTAAAVTSPRPGVFVYDMGQNIAGIPEITISGTTGQRIILRFGEFLYPHHEEYGRQQGMLMLENIRAAMAQDIFVLRGDTQVLRPSFTYHGFRYLEITGISTPLPLSQVRALAMSSASTVTATFTCSDPQINRLYQNIAWSLRDNFFSIPTDCPQRNERMGWSGDISVFSSTAVAMASCEPFLRRHLAALRDTQAENGRFADIAPLGGGFGGILWGSAGITVPWELYLQYKDRRALEDQYHSMCRYADFIEHSMDENGIVRDGPLGDWLGPENSRNEPAFLWQSAYLHDLLILKNCAQVLGFSQDLTKWQEKYHRGAQSFRDTFLDDASGETLFSQDGPEDHSNLFFEPVSAPGSRRPDGRVRIDTQTSYAVLLGYQLPDLVDPSITAARLARACRRETTDDLGEIRPPYSLMTGFIGTACICPALSDSGYDSDAWRMLRQTSYPSWLYPVRQGATTIWERLNAYTTDRGFGGNNSMNSFNHYSFGAVGFWMLGYAGGIRRGSEPGNFCICPVPDPDRIITWAKCEEQTVRGTFHVRWEYTDSGVRYDLHIPGGKKIQVTLICPEGCLVYDGDAPLADVRYENGRAYFEALPGEVTFHVY